MTDPKQNYFYIIPARLAEEQNKTKALLYGLITSLTGKDGCCIASNQYLAKKLGRKDKSIIATYLNELVREGWIRSKVFQETGNRRKICLTTPLRKKPRTSLEKSNEGSLEKSKDSNIINSKKVSISFEEFWNAYDKKVGRPKSEKKWYRLSFGDQQAIMAYIPKYKRAQPDKKYRKNPETFFNNRSWEDELIPAGNKDGTIELHDGAKAKKINGTWVDAQDINIKIDLQYYPELTKK